MSTAVSVQVRVAPELLQEIKKQASRRKVSTNRVLNDAINEYLKTEKEREWREGFELMGKDPDVCDVEYMIHAAREVVLGD